jgi:hypothetical protein
MAKRTRKAPANAVGTIESRHEKFRRLGQARVTRAVNAVRLIGNLASSNYDYSAEEVEQIKTSVQATLDEAMSKFVKRRGKHTLGFNFTEGVKIEA